MWLQCFTVMENEQICWALYIESTNCFLWESWELQNPMGNKPCDSIIQGYSRVFKFFWSFLCVYLNMLTMILGNYVHACLNVFPLTAGIVVHLRPVPGEIVRSPFILHAVNTLWPRALVLTNKIFLGQIKSVHRSACCLWRRVSCVSVCCCKESRQGPETSRRQLWPQHEKCRVVLGSHHDLLIVFVVEIRSFIDNL